MHAKDFFTENQSTPEDWAAYRIQNLSSWTSWLDGGYQSAGKKVSG